MTMRRHLDRLGISQDHVRVCDQLWTAQAYITTDIDDNQITAFHPGAMNENHRQQITSDMGIKFGIVAPGRQAGHARPFGPVCRGRHPAYLRSRPGPADVFPARNSSR